jgi:hypothetical protein
VSLLFDQFGHPFPRGGGGEPLTMEQEAAILARVTEELSHYEAEGPALLSMSAFALFELAGMLQLVARHPKISPRQREAIELFLDNTREFFAQAPAVLEILERGDDPGQDR